MKKALFLWRNRIPFLFLVCGIGYAIYVFKGYERGKKEYEALQKDFLKPAAERQTEGRTGDPTEKEGIFPSYKEVSPGDSHPVLEDPISEMNPPADEPQRAVVDWPGLREINPDVVGWISIPAVGISYPVVQAEDNEYYLHRDFNGDYLYAGSIFMDAFCDAGFANYNTIIYGHNMRDGSMFARLKDFSDPQAIQKCRYFWVQTPDADLLYEICSVHSAVEGSETFRLLFSTYEEYTHWLMKMSNLSDPVVENPLFPGDKIVTLSTCTQSGKERMTVQGKLAWKQEKQTDNKEKFIG